MKVIEQRNTPRTEIAVTEGSPHIGHRLTITRRGVEVYGWYDGYVGTGEPLYLSWEDIDLLKIRVFARVPRDDMSPKQAILCRTEQGWEIQV